MAVAVGCASSGAKAVSKTEYQKRQAEYQRVAFVCAAAPGHDTSYASMILKQAEARVPSRIGLYVKTADCLYDIPVDTSTKPPKVALGSKASNYDGVVCLVYSYSGDQVFLDMDMINVQTGQSVWHSQFDAEDKDTRVRLGKHGFWAPNEVKDKFYNFR